MILVAIDKQDVSIYIEGKTKEAELEEFHRLSEINKYLKQIKKKLAKPT